MKSRNRIIYGLALLSMTMAAQDASAAWTPIVVRQVTELGPQHSVRLEHFSRDGGHSVLLNGRIAWLYDDTECFSKDGAQLSFVSNSAAYASNPESDVTAVTDFGVTELGVADDGGSHAAILAEDTVGGGGWIPFTEEEIQFNRAHEGDQRIAIWPGTAPAPVNRTHALLYAPVVHVDRDPEDLGAKFVPRGVTVIWITAPDDGPQAVRTSALLFPGDHVPFGVLAAVVGSPSVDQADSRPKDARDVYLLGAAHAGLHLARVALDKVDDPSAYSYFRPSLGSFVEDAPGFHDTDEAEMYIPGTFTSGNVFFSPFFHTFVLMYFNRMVDSTFYVRYLDLEDPVDTTSDIWIRGGKRGRGVGAEDVEALAKYRWSAQQVLYESPPGEGGFNYAGAAHPEYFNRRYSARSRHYARDEDEDDPVPGPDHGEWYGEGEVPESSAGGDGRHMLLSWTSQIRGGLDTGIYEIKLARVEFDDVPARPMTTISSAPEPTATDGSRDGHTPKATEGLERSAAARVVGPLAISARLSMANLEDWRSWFVGAEVALLAGVITSMAMAF